METMNDFMEEIDASTQQLKRGDLVEGKVLQIDEDSIMVDINYAEDGVIYEAELMEKPDSYHVDQPIKLVVIGFSQEGQVLLSESKAEERFGLEMLQQAEKDGSLFEAKLLKTAKGGFRVEVSGVRGYLPFSLYEKGYLENPEALVGTTTTLAVERSDSRGYVFTRIPYVEQVLDKKKREFFDGHQVGDTISGIVTAFNRGGVVVDVDGIRGFIPRSEVSYSRSSKAEDLISKGDDLELSIKELDEKGNNVILSLKDMKQDPWKNIDQHVSVGDVFEVKPVGQNQNLFFYEVDDGIQGSLFKKKVPAEIIEEDRPHTVTVVNINREKRRLDLDYYYDEVVEKQEKSATQDMGNTLGDLFGDKFKELDLD